MADDAPADAAAVAPDAAARADFAAAMAALGPFESRPDLAVAVSGGADSLALLLLAADWATVRGGRAVALCVDHGLRDGSAEDAARVAGWAARRGIAHRTLTWTGDKPASRLQERARDARYRLLCGWCREEGVLHLLVGHHARDQAETVLFRLLRGSGIDGLAGMAALRETADVRILRPLLGWPPGRLRDVLLDCGQPWIEDPTNADPRYARTRLRALSPALTRGGLAVGDVMGAAAAMARARVDLDRAVADLLAECCRFHPAGIALVDREALARARREVAVRALAALAATIGGVSTPPADETVRRAWAGLRSGGRRAATFGRCRLIVLGGRLLMCRDGRGLPRPTALAAGETIDWDGRFRIERSSHSAGAGGILSVQALGSTVVDPAFRDYLCGSRARTTDRALVSSAVTVTLPALVDDGTLVCVPHLGYTRESSIPRGAVGAVWHPRCRMTGRGYFLADDYSLII